MLSTKKFFKPYFLETHSDFKNIFYDSDFAEIRGLVKKLSDLLKIMEMRIDRRETLQIAKSIFDYESQKEMYFHYPQMYYDFRFGDVRICIGRKKYKNTDEYFVNCCGFTPNERFNSTIGHYGYGCSETLDGVLTLFSDIVNDFLLTSLSALF